MCYAQIIQGLVAAGASSVAANQMRPGVQKISPIAKQLQLGESSSKSDLAAQERKKKGLRSTILSDGDQSQSGSNTLLGGG